MSKKEKAKRASVRERQEIQTIGLSSEMWDALSKEAAKRKISRNQWIKVILSHRNLIEEEEKKGRIYARK